MTNSTKLDRIMFMVVAIFLCVVAGLILDHGPGDEWTEPNGIEIAESGPIDFDQVDRSLFGAHYDVYTTMMLMCQEKQIDPNETFALYCPVCKAQGGHRTPVDSPLQMFNMRWGNGWAVCKSCKHPFGKDWKITRHVKFYYNGGCGLSCGTMVILYQPHSEFYNWIVEKCRLCGMEVHTTGNGKYEDRVFEIKKTNGTVTGFDLIKAVR